MSIIRAAQERRAAAARAVEVERLEVERARLQSRVEGAGDAAHRQRSLRRTLCVSTLFFLVVVAILVAIGFLQREALVRCWSNVNLVRTCGSDSVPCRGT